MSTLTNEKREELAKSFSTKEFKKMLENIKTEKIEKKSNWINPTSILMKEGYSIAYFKESNIEFISFAKDGRKGVIKRTVFERKYELHPGATLVFIEKLLKSMPGHYENIEFTDFYENNISGR